MNAKQQRKDRSHEAILESAARLLRAKGISGARVADVMEGAGLTVGGFYAHFDTKDALIDETLRRTGKQLRERLLAHLDMEPAGGRAKTVLRRYLSPAHRDADAVGCPLPAAVSEVATAAPQHAPAVADQVEALARELAELLTGTDSDSARRQKAIGLVALMYGGLSLARALRGTDLSDEVLQACRATGAAVTESRSDLSG